MFNLKNKIKNNIKLPSTWPLGKNTLFLWRVKCLSATELCWFVFCHFDFDPRLYSNQLKWFTTCLDKLFHKGFYNPDWRGFVRGRSLDGGYLQLNRIRFQPQLFVSIRCIYLIPQRFKHIPMMSTFILSELVCVNRSWKPKRSLLTWILDTNRLYKYCICNFK